MNIRRSCGNVVIPIGIVLLSCSPVAAAAGGAAREVRSPDGKIAITIHTDAPLGYSITVDGKPLLVRSRLGLDLADNVKLGEKPVVESEARRSADNRWEYKFGKNRYVLLRPTHVVFVLVSALTLEFATRSPQKQGTIAVCDPSEAGAAPNEAR